MADDIDEAHLRQGWRNRWLSSIEEFANDKIQNERWLDPENTNPHWSYVEYICCYFDDLNLTDGYNDVLEAGWVSHHEVSLVSNFHRLADNHVSPTDDYDHVAILADPKWAEVVAAAKVAQSALDSIITDPWERRMLLT